MPQHEFSSEQDAVEFYEDRYQKGYMEDWPEETKARMAEVIRELSLAPRGEALDFGCGNGVLTEALRRSLPPGWKVSGSDISRVAVENARSRFPECRFFEAGDPTLEESRQDLIFTHHVLEHVLDLGAILRLMDGLLRERAAMLHILPCGNPGSFEHRMMTLRRGGIDPERGNRFHHEDEGHVRRLTSDELAAELRALGFRLSRETYSNQRLGAIEYLTRFGPDVVRNFVDPSQAVDPRAAEELERVRAELLALQRTRERARQYRERLWKRDKTWKNYLYLALNAPGFLHARSVDLSCERRAREEWEARKHDRGGSAMYLFFEREARPGAAATS